ncbi:MAG: hypothetical protein ACK5KQ_03760 [Anaerorhabdus sp.]
MEIVSFKCDKCDTILNVDETLLVEQLNEIDINNDEVLLIGLCDNCKKMQEKANE